LWKIHGNETIGYEICNYQQSEHSDHCLSKWGEEDDEVSTLSRDPSLPKKVWRWDFRSNSEEWWVINQKLPSDMGHFKWRIEPLYDNPQMKWNRIEGIDNTRGQQPINLEVTYEVGVSSSTTDTISDEFATDLSLAVEKLKIIGGSIKANIGGSIPGIIRGSIGGSIGGSSQSSFQRSFQRSFQSAIETSISNGRTETQTKITQFKINPGENWWVCQAIVTFDSWPGREDVQIISSQLKIKGDMC